MSMKKILKKTVGLLLILGFFTLSASSQKLSKEEKKEARDAAMEANFYILDSLLNAKSFVLEADYLQSKIGERAPVNSTINFIKVDKTIGIIQTGSPTRVGYNNVGGVTAEGTLGKWEVEKNEKNKSYSVRFNILTNIGNYDVFMRVNSENDAEATITGSTSGKLTWVGHLVTVNNTRVFKGMPAY